MKERLLLLSDLWGEQDSAWKDNYVKPLSSKFDVHYYDCCSLGELDISIYKQDHLHRQFVTGGIDTAVSNLLALEKEPVHILAFSIGGTIAWKAALKGLDVTNLWAVSSTRLRHETEKPSCSIHCTFGENDAYKPTKEWFDRLNIASSILAKKGHEVYKDSDFALDFSSELASTL